MHSALVLVIFSAPAMISSIDSPLFATNQTRMSNRGKEGQIWRFKHLKWQIFPNTGLRKIIKKSTKKIDRVWQSIANCGRWKTAAVLSSTLSTPNRLGVAICGNLDLSCFWCAHQVWRLILHSKATITIYLKFVSDAHPVHADDIIHFVPAFIITICLWVIYWPL